MLNFRLGKVVIRGEEVGYLHRGSPAKFEKICMVKDLTVAERKQLNLPLKEDVVKPAIENKETKVPDKQPDPVAGLNKLQEALRKKKEEVKEEPKAEEPQEEKKEEIADEKDEESKEGKKSKKGKK